MNETATDYDVWDSSTTVTTVALEDLIPNTVLLTANTRVNKPTLVNKDARSILSSVKKKLLKDIFSQLEKHIVIDAVSNATGGKVFTAKIEVVVPDANTTGT